MKALDLTLGVMSPFRAPWPWTVRLFGIGLLIAACPVLAQAPDDPDTGVQTQDREAERWALFINNDPEEERHVRNLHRAVHTLGQRFDLENTDLITVGPGDPRAGVPTASLPLNPASLATAIASFVSRGARPELFVLYITGHGEGEDGLYEYPLGERTLHAHEIAAALSRMLRPEHLVVIVDTCYSGMSLEAFAGLGARTTLISSTGSTKTSCSRFAAALWSALSHPNTDLFTAFQEAEQAQQEYLDKFPGRHPPQYEEH